MVEFATVALFAAAPANAVMVRPVTNRRPRPAEGADVDPQAVRGARIALLDRHDGGAHLRASNDSAGWTPLATLRQWASRRGNTPPAPMSFGNDRYCVIQAPAGAIPALYETRPQQA